MEIFILYYLCLDWHKNGNKKEENGYLFSKTQMLKHLEHYLLF